MKLQKRLREVFLPSALLSKSEVEKLELLRDQSSKDKDSELFQAIKDYRTAINTAMAARTLTDLLLISLLSKHLYDPNPELHNIDYLSWAVEFIAFNFDSVERVYGNWAPYGLTAVFAAVDIKARSLTSNLKEDMFPELETSPQI